MSSDFSVFRAGVALVLMCSFYKSTEDSLPELSPQQYFSTLQPGKASLAYFCQVGSLSNSVFLEELKEASRPLQDYGISVAKVICVEEEASRYCGEEDGLMKAYLFRGNILLREFPTDILFDVNAIIAHVLFSLLFNEVKYITTLEDLHSIENSLKGKSNMIFSYVEAIGTPEHRAVMEAAFVYGTSYQFALTTEIALLENIGFGLGLERALQKNTNGTTIDHTEYSLICEDNERTSVAVEDDEVAGTVYRDRKRPLPLELSVELTEETFNTTVMASDSIVLFYATCRSTILLTRINCADWSDVCAKQNVTAFPVVKLYKKGESPVSYAGMLGTKDLLKFIQLNKISCPVNLASIQEAEKYLRGELYKDLFSFTSLSVLGLFSPAMTSAKEYFREAGKQLRGSVIMGVYSEDDVWILSNKYATTLPALLLARPKEGRIESVPLDTTPLQDMVQIIANAPLEEFPEITVENLPTYLRFQRPLLILFSDGNINPQYRSTVLALVGQKQLDSFTPCWLNLKEHSSGEGHLEGIFWPSASTSSVAFGESAVGWPSICISFIPVYNGTKPCVVAEKFTSRTRKSHQSVLSAQEWKPPLPAFDFLSMMDAPTSQAPTKNVLECQKESEVQESAGQQPADKSATRKEPVEMLRIKRWNRSNWPKETQEPFHHDKEL
ncbi:Thioredoxin domain-containing protein 16 [Apodemus speciosus]|uniref:Thioredoxin domain-containing protein 16 n=1 Tax=Apodemus speciosus TaxID=105296 RepID=A0ABQ0FHN1_APOSI